MKYKKGQIVRILPNHTEFYYDDEQLQAIHIMPTGSLDPKYDNYKLAIDSLPNKNIVYGKVTHISSISHYPKVHWITPKGYIEHYIDPNDLILAIKNQPGEQVR